VQTQKFIQKNPDAPKDKLKCNISFSIGGRVFSKKGKDLCDRINQNMSL
jgi:hypothetical protein